LASFKVTTRNQRAVEGHHRLRFEKLRKRLPLALVSGGFGWVDFEIVPGNTPQKRNTWKDFPQNSFRQAFGISGGFRNE
jgi:hypothetical protein